MKGIWKKVLKVDLTEKKCFTENLDEEVYSYFLGGAGLCAYYLWKEVPEHVTAFNPANRLIFAPGLLNGVRQTGAGKWAAGSLSPSMNLNADSAATGSFGIAIKEAGYDAIVVYGRSYQPVYLSVEDDKVEIKDASALWGKDAYVAYDAIREKEGEDFEVVTIGQAGERLVRFANIQTRKKSFLGRCGLGAVMGSKMLKGIAVKGSQEVSYHDPKLLNEISNEINKRCAELDAAKPEHLQVRRVGTGMGTDLFAPQGNLPLKNFRLGEWPEGVEKWKALNYIKELNPKPWPCKFCVIQCHNLCEVKEGPYAYKGKGPEYESLAMMGLNTLVDNVKAVAYAGEIANKLSMDTISLGAVIAWAMECYEKGLLTKEDTYGIELIWGNAEAVVEFTKKIGLREDGLAYLLGEGLKVASERLNKGSEAWAIQMKGQEIAAHNWRAQYISALNYCTGVASGPNHERGNSQHIWVGHIRLPEWGIGEVEEEERWTWKEAAVRNAKFHDYCNVINSAGHCKFHEFRGYTLTDLLNTINAATGLNWDQAGMRQCGERITTIQKLLNIRYGWKKEHDFNYPKRFMEPVSEGVTAGKVPLGLEDAILEYYRHREWDEEGRPTQGLIKRLKLEKFV